MSTKLEIIFCTNYNDVVIIDRNDDDSEDKLQPIADRLELPSLTHDWIMTDEDEDWNYDCSLTDEQIEILKTKVRTDSEFVKLYGSDAEISFVYDRDSS